MAVQIIIGDCREKLREMPERSVHCCITSPPYWGLRDYGVDGMIGLEESFQDWLSAMVETFREVRRVLRDDGTLFLNLGDAYASNWPCPRRNVIGSGSLANGKREARPPRMPPGLKDKDLMMQPARVAVALQENGWYLRSMLPWLKRNPMPDSATDRPGVSTEYVFMLAKSKRYYWDGESVKKNGVHEPGKHRKAFTSPRAQAMGREPSGNEKHGWYTETGFRNFRAGDLFYSSLSEPHGLITDSEGNPLALDVNTAGFSDAHFATFPPRLIEPLVKAGTSEKGVCSECGAPWAREVERTAMVIDRSDRTHPLGRTRSSGTMVEPPAAKTLGWSPSCSCNAPTVPATILDCFGGAGTTGLVADRLGRNAILIELNPEYAQMARERVQADAGMFASVT